MANALPCRSVVGPLHQRSCFIGAVEEEGGQRHILLEDRLDRSPACGDEPPMRVHISDGVQHARHETPAQADCRSVAEACEIDFASPAGISQSLKVAVKDVFFELCRLRRGHLEPSEGPEDERGDLRPDRAWTDRLPIQRDCLVITVTAPAGDEVGACRFVMTDRLWQVCQGTQELRLILDQAAGAPRGDLRRHADHLWMSTQLIDALKPGGHRGKVAVVFGPAAVEPWI